MPSAWLGPQTNQCRQTRPFTGPWESCDSIRQEHALGSFWGSARTGLRCQAAAGKSTPGCWTKYEGADVCVTVAVGEAAPAVFATCTAIVRFMAPLLYFDTAQRSSDWSDIGKRLLSNT